MTILYPQLNANANGSGGGPFEDNDSIIDEFSIGYYFGDDNSDISSMHMSDVGDIIAGVTTSAAPAGTANNGSTA